MGPPDCEGKARNKEIKCETAGSVIVGVKEISIDAESISQAFRRARDKIHCSLNNGVAYYEIMKPGKDYLLSRIRAGSTNLIYFEPEKRFTSKRILSRDILNTVVGDLRLVDPYCNERTLDVLKDVRNRKVKLLTRLENLREEDKRRFLRELQDFTSENEDVEFRTYPYTDLHDRYIISEDSLVILGHSIKDLGGKESLAVILKKDVNSNIVDALIESFDRRWKQSSPV